jgi:hypothetical protein
VPYGRPDRGRRLRELPASARRPPYQLDEVAVVAFALEPGVGLYRTVGVAHADHDVTVAVMGGVPGL